MIRMNGYAERWFAGAGALGFDGFDGGHPPLVRLWKAPFRTAGLLDPHRFTVISKTVTLSPRTGRQTNWGFRKYAWPVFPLSQRSMTNAVALTNPGLDAWIAQYYPVAVRRNVRIVLSLHVEDVTEARVMGHMCKSLKGLCGVQINAGCPNLAAHSPGVTPTDDEEAAEFTRIIDEFQRHYSGSLLVKFRLGQPWEKMAVALEGRCAGYELINAVPWDAAAKLVRDGTLSDMVVDTPSPLQKYGYGGSVSGGRIAYQARAALARYKSLGLKTPVISGGGVVPHPESRKSHCGTPSRERISLKSEALTRLAAGAMAVSFSTAFLWEPWGPNRAANALDRDIEATQQAGAMGL